MMVMMRMTVTTTPGGGVGWKVLPAQRIVLEEVIVEGGPEDGVSLDVP